MADDKPGMVQFQFRAGSSSGQRVADRKTIQQYGTMRVSSEFASTYCLDVSAEHNVDEVGAAVRALDSVDTDSVEVRR